MGSNHFIHLSSVPLLAVCALVLSMAMMVLEESQDCSWVARGWEVISLFVCFLYSFKAAVNIVSKVVEDDVEVDRT